MILSPGIFVIESMITSILLIYLFKKFDIPNTFINSKEGITVIFCTTITVVFLINAYFIEETTIHHSLYATYKTKLK